MRFRMNDIEYRRGGLKNIGPHNSFPEVTRGTGMRDVDAALDNADLKVQFKDSQLGASRKTAHTAF